VQCTYTQDSITVTWVVADPLKPIWEPLDLKRKNV
jgi:hypothetical protein